MTSDLRIQGEVVVNSEQAESAFNRVGDKAQQMATEVATSATKAGQAVDKIGDGAGASAEKFTRAESRISASIKRATNELELLGKTASQRLEFNISDKGLDTAKFEPALKKLRELEAQAQQAQRAASGSLDKMGISAAQTAAALRGVPAQFTDIVTSLQGGQAPLTVFLQQGGQLRDMFGGAGNAARALGGYVLGLVNPFTIAAAAVAGIAVAYNQGAKEADAYRAALITTGNAAGTNAAQLKSYAQEISSVVGTQGKAAEALSALAATGKVGAENLREAAQAAVAYERATGQAASKTAEQFASLRNEPLAAVLKLNEGMNFLTDSTYKQIKSLEEQGKTAEAANVAQRAFADTLSGRAGEMERNLGTVERGWIAVKDAAKSAWDAILNVGRASTSVDQLAEVRKQIAQRENQIANGGFGANEGGAAFGRPSQAATERLRAELAGLQAKAAALEGVSYATRVSAEEERKRGEAVKAGAAFDKAGEKFLSDKTRMERELAAARVQGAEAGRSQEEIEKRLGEIRASYAKKGGGGVAAENKELRDQQRIFAELAGVSSTYYAELANAQKQRAAGVITEQQYVQAVEALIKKQPFAVAIAKEQADATKAQAKASEEAAKAHLKYVESFGKGAAAAQQQADQLRTEEAAAVIAAGGYYSLAQAIELVTIARLEEKRDGLLGNEEAYLAVQKEIDARKELVGLIGSKEARKASEDAAKDAQRDWERAAADIERSLTDSLLRGFESGKDFAKNLRDTVVNMFKTMVLRPVISAIVNPVAGAITGALGLSGAANAGTGGGVLGAVGTGASIYNAGTGLAGMAGGFANGLSAWGAGGSVTGVLSNPGLYSAAELAGALAPISLGIGAIYAIAKSLDDSGTYHTGGAAQYSAAGGLLSGQSGANYNIGFGRVEAGADSIKAVGGIAQALGTALDGVAVSFGQKAGYEIATAFADDTSKDGAWGALRISKDGKDLLNWEQTRQSRWAPKEFADGESGYKEYLAAVAKDTRQVLLDMDLPSWADTIITSIGDAANMDQLSAAVQQIGQIQTAFEVMGQSMQMFSGLTDEMQSGLLSAAGSIDALVTSTGTFYQGFYTESERMDSAVKQLKQSLGEMGLSIDPAMGSDAKAQFRDAVQGAMDAGNAQLATSLLGISGNFATAADYFERLSQTTADSAKNTAREVEQAARAMEDALSRALSSVASNRFDLENQLLTQAGQGDLVQQRIDQRDLAELTKGLPEEQAAKVREQFEANLKLRDQYEANQLAADNLAKAMEEMERQQNAAAQAQRSMLQGTVTSAQNAVTQLKSIFDMLDSSIASLRGSVTSAVGQDSRAAREYIARASVLMRSGSVVDSGKLSAAVRSATAGIDNQQFANSSEADFERLKLAGELAGLKDSTAGQLTVAEQHLSIAESQLAALEYIASSISSLAGAQQAAAGQPRDQWSTVSGKQVYASSGGAVGVNTGSGLDIYGKDGSLFTGAEAIAFVRNQVAVNDEASVYAAAVRTGISSKALDELMGWDAGTSNAWAEMNKLPKFAVGTNYVPRDMYAQIHEGEAIVPKAFNPWANGSTGGDNTALIAELRALRAEVAQLRPQPRPGQTPQAQLLMCWCASPTTATAW